MAFIKSKKGFLTLFAVVCAFGLFAGVTFVQSQDTQVQSADAKTTGMPSSCADVHKQALGAEKAALINAEGCQVMTPEQCREMMAKHGIECDVKDMQACMEKMKAAGLCKGEGHEGCAAMKVMKADVEIPAKSDMKVVSKDMESCLKGMKAGSAECKDMAKTAGASGSCCAAGKVIKADVETSADEAKTETVTEKKVKQCDILTGKCTTAKKTESKSDL